MRGATLGMLLALFPVLANSLGLGELRVESYLGEPLRASVPLRLAGERQPVDCILRNETGPEQREPGIPQLADVKVLAEAKGDGVALTITTKDPVREPIFGLVLRADCGGGAVVRRYTALLDPPLPPVLRPALERALAPTPPAAAASPGRAPEPERRRPSGRTWTVLRGETLSGIAAQLAPSEWRSQARLVAALVEANPDVFPDGDPDRMPAGAVLQLPDLPGSPSPAREAPAPAPLAERSPAAPASAAPAEPPAQLPPAEEPAPPRHRLTLEATDLAIAQPRTVDERMRVLDAQSEADYAEAEALKARISALQSQITRLEEVIASLDRVNVPAPEPPAQIGGAAAAPVPVRSAPRPVELASALQVSGPVAPDTEQVWWAAAFFVVVGLLMYMLLRRQGGGTSEEGSEDGPAAAFAGTGHGASAAAYEAQDAGAPFAADPLAGWEPESEPPAEPPEPMARGPGMLLKDLNFQGRETAPVLEANNLLVRAEFHLLLRQPEQAVRLLVDTIEGSEKLRREPALWLMLLRIYRQEKRRAEFNRLCNDFLRLFNIAVPKWNEGRRLGAAEGLETKFPRILQRICEQWETPACGDFLDQLLIDDRDGTRGGFDLAVAEDILLLKGVWQARNEA